MYDLTLGQKLKKIYVERAMQLGKIGDWAGDRQLVDEKGEFRKEFGGLILSELQEIARAYGEIPLGVSKKCKVKVTNVECNDSQGWVWHIDEKKGLNDTGFWLHGAHGVDAEFEYVASRTDGEIELTDIRTRWVWHDEIDARSGREWWRAKETWQEVYEGLGNGVKKSTVDIIGDKCLDADYKVEINTGWFEFFDVRVPN